MSDDRLRDARACVFEAYGTLFDVASATQRCVDALSVETVVRLAALWRDKQLEYTQLRAIESREVKVPLFSISNPPSWATH
jgi:2-haloacid dehalogenase